VAVLQFKKNQFLQLTNQILTEGNAQTMLLFNSTITVKNRHDTYNNNNNNNNNDRLTAFDPGQPG